MSKEKTLNRDLFDLTGKVAIVSGAAGIQGTRITRGLAGFGAAVACVDIAGKTKDVTDFFTPPEDFKFSVWREVMAVNLDGMFLVAQAVGKQMIAQGTGGSIIQTSSTYGVVGPDPGIYEGSEYLDHQINTPPAYAASKAAIIGLTKYLATYWAPYGIRVNTLVPGGIESGQNEEFQKITATARRLAEWRIVTKWSALSFLWNRMRQVA